MCGIVGVAGDFTRAECLEIVRRMNDRIAHRGPDDEGLWAEDGFGFGMRRLSIIDLAGGHQPMWDERAGLGVVFNGEVYNYRQLRRRLEDEGAGPWTTTSDTEVVLRSLARDGEAAIQSWNGMFGVAAWDARRKSLTLIRDRMGVKPLYYFYDGRTLLFASEIKALLASGLVPRRVNRQAAWDYLTFRYVPGSESVWEGVRKLQPGHLLRFPQGGAPEEVCYWRTDVVADAEEETRTDEEAEREFTSLLLDAVELRLVASDVPVGVFLSGGLDSSAIAAAAVELGHKDFHTFTVGFEEGGEFSELRFARQMAEHVGARYHEVVVNQRQFLDMLPEVVVAADEPLADLTLVPLLAVSRLAREHVKVVLSGEGSDEILAGYNLDESERMWAGVRRLQRIPRPVLTTGAALSRLALPAHLQRRAEKLSTVPLAEWNLTARPHITRYFGQTEKESLWPGAVLEDSERILDAQYRAARSDDPLQQLLSVYQKSWLVEDLLMKADKMSMAASLEARTPFLDYRLVEWANRQPNRVKVKQTGLRKYRTKEVLRRFCARRVPAEILTRPKQGFPVPAYRWLQNGLQGWAHDTLLGPASRTRETFDAARVRRLLEDARAGLGDAPHRVWILLVLELWLRAWDARLAAE
jgi:asparagine synthase (glutamine-hydrolysing)